MKKKILLFVLAILFLCGCQYSNNQKYDIDTSAIENEIQLSDFDLNMIKLTAVVNGEEIIVPVDESMLSNEDLEKLTTPGVHQIRINYNNNLFVIIVELIDDTITPAEVSYSLDTSGLQTSVDIKDFDLSCMKIKVTSEDSVRYINVNETMISEEDAKKLQVAGTHEITIIYRTFSEKVSIVLIDTNEYEIDLSKMPSSSLAGYFDISTIRIKCTNSTGTSYITVDETMLSNEDLNKLNTAGTHSITIVYGSYTATINITLIGMDVSGDVFSSTMAYYKDANGLTGMSLKKALRTIISKVTHKETYNDLKTDTIKSDTDPNNSSNILLFYTRISVNGKWDGANTWNREHVWAQSLGWFETSGAGSDLHHLRPEDPTINSTRGNKKFGEIKNQSNAKRLKFSDANGGGYSDCYYAGNYFEPQDEVKGDVARIIFYLMVRYSEADNYTFTSIAQSKEMLIKWHLQDPVDELEMYRNEAVYKIQGNRNPFIDHPEIVSLIYGTSYNLAADNTNGINQKYSLNYCLI